MTAAELKKWCMDRRDNERAQGYYLGVFDLREAMVVFGEALLEREEKMHGVVDVNDIHALIAELKEKP